MKHLLIKGGKLLLAGYILTSCNYSVKAAATLTLYDGVNPLITVVDNGPGDLFGGTGLIQVQTNVGVWYSVTVNPAETKPLLGSSTQPVMDLHIQASSSAAGSLRFVFSDADFGPASGTLTATVNGSVVSGAGVTDSYGVYGDPANVVGATTVFIASTSTLPLPISASGSGPLALPTPFSLTEVEQFDASGPTTINVDASFLIPEPSVAGLGTLGLAVLALGRLQRRQA